MPIGSHFLNFDKITIIYNFLKVSWLTKYFFPPESGSEFQMKKKECRSMPIRIPQALLPAIFCVSVFSRGPPPPPIHFLSAGYAPPTNHYLPAGYLPAEASSGHYSTGDLCYGSANCRQISVGSGAGETDYESASIYQKGHCHSYQPPGTSKVYNCLPSAGYSSFKRLTWAAHCTCRTAHLQTVEAVDISKEEWA